MERVTKDPMKAHDVEKTAKRASAEPRESDFFYDELMTAQPEATREFYRARLLQAPRNNTKR